VTKKKALEVLGAFLSFFFILVGIYILTALRVASLPSTIQTTYFIDIPDRALTLSCAMISAGLTYFWFQRRK
jgi:hypothetical protein